MSRLRLNQGIHMNVSQQGSQTTALILSQVGHPEVFINTSHASFILSTIKEGEGQKRTLKDIRHHRPHLQIQPLVTTRGGEVMTFIQVMRPLQ